MRKGFTLIELITVIALIVILAAVTVPSVQSFLPFFSLNSTSKLVSAKLRQAQEEAITTQSRHSLRFHLDVNPGTYELIKIADTEEVIESGSLEVGISVAFNPAATNNEIIFSADGGPNWSGTITIGHNGEQKNIEVSPSGFIKNL